MSSSSEARTARSQIHRFPGYGSTQVVLSRATKSSRWRGTRKQRLRGIVPNLAGRVFSISNWRLQSGEKGDQYVHTRVWLMAIVRRCLGRSGFGAGRGGGE